MDPKRRCSRLTTRQQEIFVDFMERHPDLCVGLVTKHFSKEKRKHLWNNLAEKLNSDGWGPIKTVIQWKKSWTDLKSNIRLKAKQMKRNEMTGGPAADKVLTSFEQRLLDMIGWVKPTRFSDDQNGSALDQDDSFQENMTEPLRPQDEGSTSHDESFRIKVEASEELNEQTKTADEPPKVPDEPSKTSYESLKDDAEPRRGQHGPSRVLDESSASNSPPPFQASKSTSTGKKKIEIRDYERSKVNSLDSIASSMKKIADSVQELSKVAKENNIILLDLVAAQETLITSNQIQNALLEKLLKK